MERYAETTSLIVPDLKAGASYIFQIRPITYFQLQQLYEKNRKIFEPLESKIRKAKEKGVEIRPAPTPVEVGRMPILQDRHEVEENRFSDFEATQLLMEDAAAREMHLTPRNEPLTNVLSSLSIAQLTNAFVLEKHFSESSAPLKTLADAPRVRAVQVAETTTTTATIWWQTLELQPLLLPRLRLLGFDVRLYAKENGKPLYNNQKMVFVDRNLAIYHHRIFPNRIFPNGKEEASIGAGLLFGGGPADLLSPPQGPRQMRRTGSGGSGDQLDSSLRSPSTGIVPFQGNSQRRSSLQKDPPCIPFLTSLAYGKVHIVDLAGATDYYAQVRARTSAGHGEWSAEIPCKTTLAIATPEPPQPIYAQETQLSFVVQLDADQDYKLKHWDCRLHHLSGGSSTRRGPEEFRVHGAFVRRQNRRCVITLSGLEKDCSYQVQVRGVAADNVSKSTWSVKSEVMRTSASVDLCDDTLGGAGGGAAARGGRLRTIPEQAAGSSSSQNAADLSQGSAVGVDENLRLLAGGEDALVEQPKDVSAISKESYRQLQTSLETVLNFIVTRALKGVKLPSVEYKPINEEAVIQRQMHGGSEEAVAWLINEAEKQGGPGGDNTTSMWAAVGRTEQLVDFLVGLIPVVGLPGVFLKEMFFRIRNCALIAELYGVDTINNIEAQAMILTCLIPGQNIDNIHKRQQEGGLTSSEVSGEYAAFAPGSPGTPRDGLLNGRGAPPDPLVGSPQVSVTGGLDLSSGSDSPSGGGVLAEDPRNLSAAGAASGEAPPITNLSEMVDVHDINDITRAVAKAVVKETVILASGLTSFSRLVDIVMEIISYRPPRGAEGEKKGSTVSPEALAAAIFQPQPWYEQLSWLSVCVFFWLLPTILSFVRFMWMRILPIFQIAVLAKQEVSLGLVIALVAIGWSTSIPLVMNAQAIREWAQNVVTRLPSVVVFGVHASLPAIGCFLGARDIMQPIVDPERGWL